MVDLRRVGVVELEDLLVAEVLRLLRVEVRRVALGGPHRVRLAGRRITSCPAGPLLPNISSTFLSAPFQATTCTACAASSCLSLRTSSSSFRLTCDVDLQVLQVGDQVLHRLLVRAAPSRAWSAPTWSPRRRRSAAALGSGTFSRTISPLSPLVMLILSMSSGALMVGKSLARRRRRCRGRVFLLLLVDEAPEQAEDDHAEDDELVARHVPFLTVLDRRLTRARRWRARPRRRRQRSETVQRRSSAGMPRMRTDLDVALLALARLLHARPPACGFWSSLSSGVILSLRVAVDQVRIAEDLRADGEQVGVAGQPVERVLEDEDGAR